MCRRKHTHVCVATVLPKVMFCVSAVGYGRSQRYQGEPQPWSSYRQSQSSNVRWGKGMLWETVCVCVCVCVCFMYICVCTCILSCLYVCTHVYFQCY